MGKGKVSKSVNKLYASAVNLRGLYSKSPIVVFYNDDSDTYKDGAGLLEVKKNGLDFQENFITFASQAEDEVKAFISGVSAILKILSKMIDFRTIE